MKAFVEMKEQEVESPMVKVRTFELLPSSREAVRSERLESGRLSLRSKKVLGWGVVC